MDVNANGVCKCGCIYSSQERSFIKYCREHAMMILRKRFESATKAGKP